jgi:cell division cycle protein 20 (cofactor of APC complex)
MIPKAALEGVEEENGSEARWPGAEPNGADRFFLRPRGAPQQIPATRQLALLQAEEGKDGAVEGKGRVVSVEENGRPRSGLEVLTSYAMKLRQGHSYQRNLVAYGNGTTTFRDISFEPEKVLDAPGIVDDFYLNCLSWSVKNVLAIALGGTIYLWHGGSGAVTELCSLNDGTAKEDYVSSLSWIHDGSFLAVGSSDSTVQIWDVERAKRMRMFASHTGRVSSLAWSKHILSSGAYDGAIRTHDVRVAKHLISSQLEHKGQICGLQWSHDGRQLASGSNDNCVRIWDAASSSSSLFAFSHNAAVKALSWCPWQMNTLVTGGGSRDRMLRFWNTSSGICTRSVDTNSQVSSVIWSKTHRELISAHGHSSNGLCIWKYPSLALIKEIPAAHDSRILHMTMSPDGERVATVAADENLKIWRVFERPKEAKTGKASDRSLVTVSHLMETGAKNKGSQDLSVR